MTQRDQLTSKRPDLADICRRVREKSASYSRYHFSEQYNDFLKAFFDLAQEYDSLENYYRICVAVPLEFTGLESRLYLCDDSGNRLDLVCDSFTGVRRQPEPVTVPGPIHLSAEPYETESSYVIPIYSKPPVSRSDTDFTAPRPAQGGAMGESRIHGMYEIMPLDRLTADDKFFFVKYANRIGYNLHNRMIALQNIDHLKFINNLVMDIEHNIIVPNMYFKHLFNQLKRKIVEMENLQKRMERMAREDSENSNHLQCLKCYRALREDLFGYHRELVKHHANVSLFLESLFRREHFVRGHLVLRPKKCFVEKEVIIPQLENYRSRLEAAGITVERPRNMIDEEFPILVDVGLLAQVYANLFSNAAKYTREIIDHSGRPRKSIAYGREIVENYSGDGKRGIKFNVFSTGPPLSPEEAESIFDEGVRGRDVEKIPGTGHGLSFIKHVIEMHGGSVGYESTEEGNNFYFILPLPDVTDYDAAPGLP